MRRLARLVPAVVALVLGFELGSYFRHGPKTASAAIEPEIVVNHPSESTPAGRKTTRLHIRRARGNGVNIQIQDVPVDADGALVLAPDDWMISLNGTTYIASTQP